MKYAILRIFGEKSISGYNIKKIIMEVEKAMKKLNKGIFRSDNGKKEILTNYKKRLNKLPVKFHTKQVQTTFGETFLIEAGDSINPTIVLLHGSGSNSIMWFDEISKFSQNYHVYAIDILGEPGFSSENRLSLTTEDYNIWLMELFHILKIEKVILIGLSLGGFLAAKFAISHRDRVSHLVLISPSGIGKQKGSFLIHSLWYMLQGRRGVKKLYIKINGGKKISSETMEYLLLLQQNFIYRKEPIPIFTDKELVKLTMPVALIVGKNDIMIDSHDTQQRLNILLKNFTSYFIPNGGHSLGSQYKTIYAFLQ